MAYQQTIALDTNSRGTPEITREVARVVAASAVETGHVFVQHTSCSVLITENAEPRRSAQLG